jgi:light-regulated signal transduction histidine kinase (bacteriophytochrome)
VNVAVGGGKTRLIKFYQRNEPSYTGFGIGLALSKQLTSLHRGTIAFIAKSGKVPVSKLKFLLF